MGLDSVELIILVEERFGISLSDEEAQSIVTVGDFYEVILSKLSSRSERIGESCLSSSIFYRLRLGLMESFSISRSAIRLDASIKELIPWNDRKAQWGRLSQASGLVLPQLKRPNWVESIVAVLALSGVACLIFLMFGLYFLWASLLLWLNAWLLWKVTQPLAIYVPNSCDTLRSTVQTVTALNFHQLKTQTSWNKSDVWNALVAIIREKFAVSSDKIEYGTSFLNDLGID